MKIIYSKDHVLHEPGLEFNLGQMMEIPEVPERIMGIYKYFQDKMNEQISFAEKKVFSDSYILDVHAPDYYEFLQIPQSALAINVPCVFPKPGLDNFKSTDPVANLGRYFFDTGVPLWEDSFPAIRSAVDCALTGAEIISTTKENVYALIRPPGHHAASNYGGGYCYLNNAAIATGYLSKRADRVSILDIDFHHGNGTQQIFYNTDRVQFVSLHGSPQWAYPYYSGFRDEIGEGEGKGYNLNFPLVEDIRSKEYLSVLDKACKEIGKYNPDYLILSAGYDIIFGDPAGFFNTKTEDFIQIGEKIAGLNVPTLIVQEGGYDAGNNTECAKNLINSLL